MSCRVLVATSALFKLNVKLMYVGIAALDGPAGIKSTATPHSVGVESRASDATMNSHRRGDMVYAHALSVNLSPVFCGICGHKWFTVS